MNMYYIVDYKLDVRAWNFIVMNLIWRIIISKNCPIPLKFSVQSSLILDYDSWSNVISEFQNSIDTIMNWTAQSCKTQNDKSSAADNTFKNFRNSNTTLYKYCS